MFSVAWIVYIYLLIIFSSVIFSEEYDMNTNILNIESNPPGAEIYINNNYFNKTPVSLENFPSGIYNLKLNLLKYNVYESQVKLYDIKSRNITIELERMTGVLEISGTPELSHMDVIINGEVKLTDKPGSQKYHLNTGQHIVEIIKKNYKGFIDTINIMNGEVYEINYNLEKYTGFLCLDIKPKDAIAYIGDLLYEPFIEIACGKHNIYIVHPNYEDSITEIDIYKNDTIYTDISLKRKLAVVHFTTEPSNALLSYENKKIDSNQSLTLPFGRNEILVSSPNYYKKIVSLDINKERTNKHIALINGKKDFRAKQIKRNSYFLSTILFFSFSYANYVNEQMAFINYINSTNTADAQRYRLESEKYMMLKHFATSILGINTGILLYNTIDLEHLKVRLSLNE